MNQSLGDLLQARIAEQPDKVALVSREGRRTWRELGDEVRSLSRRLATCAPAGSTVALGLPHGEQLVSSVLAAINCGQRFVILNQKLTQDQKRRILLDANVSIIVADKPLPELIGDFRQEHHIAVLDYRRWGQSEKAFHEFQTASESPQRWIAEDIACYVYTSGSTGYPKGIAVPHRTLVDGANIVSGYLGVCSDDVILSILPLSFDYGFNQLAICLETGATLVLHQHALPQDLIEVVAQERVTVLAGVPSLWPPLIAQTQEDFENVLKLQSLRIVTTAGGPHPKVLVEQLKSLFSRAQIFIMYGLSESFRSTYLEPNEMLRRIGSIGKAVPGVQILVLDERGNECAPGEIGELHHRGAFITYGYLNDDELTRQKFVMRQFAGPGCRPEIIVRSGDLVSRDEDGFLYFHGRRDAQIKAFGYRVSPTEVEDVALGTNGVRQAAAFPLESGEVNTVVALAVVVDGDASEVKRGLAARLQEGLPTYAQPRFVFDVASLPLTANGKTDYQALRRADWRATERADD